MSASPQSTARGDALPAADVTLRAATALDAGALGQMITDAVLEHTWKPRLHSAAEDIAHAADLIDRGWVSIATRTARPEAFLSRDDTYVHALFTTPAARRQGLGTALLSAAQQACDRLDLWTFQANAAARAFYTRHGFAEVERTSGANDEGLPDIHFRWTNPR